MIWLIITIAVILLYLFALAPRLSRRDAMRAFSGTMFAHRGYHCKERGIPENSMKAFRAAIARGYGIELDLHLTKDGRLAVFHDDTLERMCKRTETVEELTSLELSSCTLLDTDETIPMFEDVLTLVRGPSDMRRSLKTNAKLSGPLSDPVLQHHGTSLVQASCHGSVKRPAFIQPDRQKDPGILVLKIHGQVSACKLPWQA